MFAQQYRPEIARVAEETVLTLKQLESRIEVLKNDLAALCTVVGHPEAARIAVTPAAWLGVTQPHLAQGNFGSVGGLGTTQGQNVPPQFQQGYGSVPGQGLPPQFQQNFGSVHGQGFPPQFQQGYGSVPGQGLPPQFQQGYGHQVPPMGQPFGSTLGISPLTSPWTQGISPWTQGISPWTQGPTPYGPFQGSQGFR